MENSAHVAGRPREHAQVCADHAGGGGRSRDETRFLPRYRPAVPGVRRPGGGQRSDDAGNAGVLPRGTPAPDLSARHELLATASAGARDVELRAVLLLECVSFLAAWRARTLPG